MKDIVLDSFALIAYLEDEKGACDVVDIFKTYLEKDINIFMCVVNWGEVYYHARRVGGEDTAQLFVDTINALPINIIDADKNITLQAATYKSEYKMSYADCYAAALAKIKDANLLTGDKEFKQVEKIINISWIT